VQILVDTGVLIAAIDRRDVDHADAAAVLELYAGQLLVSTADSLEPLAFVRT
jgi:predicted nucleic acid-binding protein